MAKRIADKKKHHLKFRQQADFIIPPDNVLDLKKIVAAREEKKEKQESAAEKKGLFSRLRKQKKKQPANNKISSFLVKEKKIIPPISFRKKVFTNPFRKFPAVNPKALAGFLIVAVAIILPIYVLASYHKVDELKGRVLGVSWEAYNHFSRAGQAFADLDFGSASTEFDSALGYFTEAQEMLQTVSGVLKLVPVKGGEVAAAESLLKAGEAISTAGQYVAKAFAPLVTFSESSKESINIQFNFATALLLANTNLRPAISELERAEHYLEKVSPKILPEEYQAQFVVIKDNLPTLNKTLKESLDLSDLLLQVLGHGSGKRYLVVFQNNAELRPTGGFIGSFALVTLEEGVMKELEIPGGGSYDLNGWLKERVISPKPLHLVNPHWYFQDANWFPDFPSSAQKLIWFFNQSGGPSVDGVMALTPDVIESLLELSGPIDLTEKYGEVITKDNFREILQQEAEKKYEETKESKKIISELTPLVFNKILGLEQTKQLQALAILNNLLKEKFLLFYFNDPELENVIVNQGWGGEIKMVPKDYLSVINTNIRGGKTDLMMEEKIDHQINISEDGTATATVTVTRTHKGKEGDAFSGINNTDFMRFYVPQGSQLIEAKGFDRIDPKLFIYPNEGYLEDEDLKRIEQNVMIDENSDTRISEEFGKTVFGNWVVTEPGKSSQVSVTYRLPFKIKPEGLFERSASYSLFVQKQPGTKGSIFTSQITYHSNYQILWQYPPADSFKFTKGQGEITTMLDTDHYLGFVLEQ